MDFESRVLIFMFFNCTMVRDIHTMGKILLPYIVKNLASFNDQNKKVESSAEIYRDQSLV